MISITNSFGAEAEIYIKSPDDITTLGTLISQNLEITNFCFDTDMNPPHEIFGMSGALGFQVWLYHSEVNIGYNYQLSIRTTASHTEIMNEKMHNLSLWLARFTSLMCKVDTCVNLNGEQIYFKSVA